MKCPEDRIVREDRPYGSVTKLCIGCPLYSECPVGRCKTCTTLKLECIKDDNPWCKFLEGTVSNDDVAAEKEMDDRIDDYYSEREVRAVEDRHTFYLQHREVIDKYVEELKDWEFREIAGYIWVMLPTDVQKSMKCDAIGYIELIVWDLHTHRYDDCE